MSFATRQIPPFINTNKSHSRAGSQSSIKSPRSPASPFDPLSAALATAQARYTLSNSKSLKAHNEACHDFPGGNTRTVLHTSPFPLTFLKGEGCELTTADGDTYVDFLGEFTAGIYGHSNKLIAAAVAEAMKDGWNFGGPNRFERELARKITTRFSPSGLELIRFTNSGTEATTMAVAASLAFTSRTKILVFQHGYHGGTFSFPSPLKPISVNLPHDFVIAPYNDIPGTRAIIESLPPKSLAAVLVEPIQGSGGCVVGSVEFLKYLNATAHSLGALFIVDEVMTSRLCYNGLSSKLGLMPDLITLGKWVGGGMTFGAFGGRRNGGVMGLFDPRSGALGHSGTFNNNVVTMAAGCAGMDIYDQDAVERLNAWGERLKAGVEKVLDKYGVRPLLKLTKPDAENSNNEISVEDISLEYKHQNGIMWISGQGSMLNVHFSGNSKASLQPLFWHSMLDQGINIAQRGFIALNLELREEHIEKFIKAVDSFVARYRTALTA